MRRKIVLFGLAAAVALAADERKPALSDFAWLSGCWQGVSRANQIDECWTTTAPDAMLGVFRMVGKEKTTLREFILLEDLPEGIVMTVRHVRPSMADPQGQATSFKLVRHNNGEAVFENIPHQKPGRIIYRSEPDGSLLARIENLDGEKVVSGVDFPMKRAPAHSQ